jgi:hypothetical protein
LSHSVSDVPRPGFSVPATLREHEATPSGTARAWGRCEEEVRVKPSDDRPDLWVAVTFAEAGEWDTARRHAGPPGKARAWAWLERHLVAAALAEEGQHADALRVLRNGSGPGGPRREGDALDALLRARGVRMLAGVLSPETLGARI